MNIFSFRKVICNLGLVAILSLPVVNCSYKASAETNDYPLLSIKLLLVPEDFACVRYGYPDGCEEPLTYKKVAPEIMKGETVTEAKNIPAAATVRLNNGLRVALSEYYMLKLTNRSLGAEDRKSVVAIFDFGSLSRSSDFKVDITWIQPDGKDCVGPPLKMETGSYSHVHKSYNQYMTYHISAELFTPCANVTWIVKVTETETGKQYPSWIFKTTSE